MYIQAEGIQKSYGQRKVVNSVDLEIKKNEIVAVIGPNGAGKTTTLEMLIGLRKADSGKVTYWVNRYKSSIGVQLQAIPFFPGLTAKENIKLFAAFYKINLGDGEAYSLLDSCGLRDAAQVEASKLSGGQQKRLAIAASLVHDPELVFLDEPTAALDPRSRMEIHQLIGSLHQNGKTVVFTSHDMGEVMKLATRVIMINKGEVIVEGKPREICKSYHASDLENLYLLLTSKEGQ
ncbi:ABC transporter [Bacillus sp. FJAT-27225]|uniref:ABC transporter ATP-binding protein n=1 Tax=Bacillus sp. FJAT-27225 TaxID=1743144 RepID=UPI00080C288F|nr:ABC transporter ATP-binding protein [Bacillus sp. FJAT-27225]OCA82296.1 ABC transporter [Bacillus sp. FJAT-27225]